MWLTYFQGPITVAAVDSGPSVSVVAGEGSIGAGAAESSPDLRSADQQTGGAVEGEPGRQTGGSREAGRGRGAAAGPAQVGVAKTYFI